MKIKGINLGEVDVEFSRLSERGFKASPEILSIIQYLENFYYDIMEQAKSSVVNDFPYEDDKVRIIPGMINHRCTNNLEILKTISQYGILASEWFGILESEKEGRFCAFVDRIKPDNFRDPYYDSKRLNLAGNNIILFFDTENELMKRLLHLDYFEYEKFKKVMPDKIEKMYSIDEINLFEKLISPLSPAGKNFHDEKNKDKLEFYYWSAIPGGIPSILVNGICLKNNQYSEEYIQTLTQLFPNATIFKGDLQIIYRPEKTNDDSKKL